MLKYRPYARAYPLKSYLAGSNIFTLKHPEVYLTPVYLDNLDLVFPDHVEIETIEKLNHNNHYINSGPIKITIEKIDGKTVITLPAVPEDLREKRGRYHSPTTATGDFIFAENPVPPPQVHGGWGAPIAALDAGAQAYANAAQPAYIPRRRGYRIADPIPHQANQQQAGNAIPNPLEEDQAEGPPPIPPAP